MIITATQYNLSSPVRVACNLAVAFNKTTDQISLAKATDTVAPNFTKRENRPANPILDDLTIGNNLADFQRAISIAQGSF